MSFSRPRTLHTSLLNSPGPHSSARSTDHERAVCPRQEPDQQKQRSNLQLTLAVLTALGIVLFPAVLGLS